MVKKIHYCWFGGANKSPLIIKCIESWKKHFPDFEIIEWNESNFEVNALVYTKQAYELGQYAFVSDAARFAALYEQGGLYFDTDVEVVKPFGALLENDAFAALETESNVNPGLVTWFKQPKNPIAKEMLDFYATAKFTDENGNRLPETMCTVFTKLMRVRGFKDGDRMQKLDGIVLYPTECFSPYDDATGRLKKTDNTYAIHWYAKSWMPKRKILRNKITRVIHRIFGKNSLKFLKRRK